MTRHEEEVSTLTRSKSAKSELQRIKWYMDEHYPEPLTIADLARMANISPNYFVDLFKKTFGISAMDYLTQVRMNWAKRFLSESDERLKDIALKVGYTDEFYFSRKFKKEVGMSPSFFTQKYQKRVAAFTPSAWGHMLALDMTPVAAPLSPKWSPYYYNSLRLQVKTALEFVDLFKGARFETNIERLQRVRPDLIVASDHMEEPLRERLTGVAPCFFLPPDSAGWRSQLRALGRKLSREEQAEEWIKGYEKQVELAKAHIAPITGNDKVLTLRLYGQNVYKYCNWGMADVLYRDMELASPWSASCPCNIPIALEQLAEVNPERIILAVCQESSTRMFWLSLQHSRIWKQLKAVQLDQVYCIPSDPWFEYSPVSVHRILNEVLLLFTGKCPSSFLENVPGCP